VVTEIEKPYSHEISSGENCMSLECTVPEIFGNEQSEQTCEQTASTYPCLAY